MNEARCGHRGYGWRCSARLSFFFSILALGPRPAETNPVLAQTPSESVKSPGRTGAAELSVGHPFVVTQLPVGTEAERQGALAAGTLRARFGDGARLVIVYPDRSTKVLSEGFHSACDPEISFDAAHILFAAKRTPADDWNIFEMSIDGSNVRQVTSGIGDCRGPCYQPPLYTIAPPKPKDHTTPVGSQEVTESWADMIALRHQIAFVGSQGGFLNECGVISATNLYSCKLDGSAVWRLTFNLSSDMDPFIMQDGRLLFASWQRARLDRGLPGRIALFGVNIDGTDYAAFCTEQGKRIKHMPCTTSTALAVFVEGDKVPWDGAGSLGCVRVRRPLHSYRPITGESDGLFHSPSSLPDGTILVSRRSADGSDTHGVYRLDPVTGQRELIFDDPDYHDVQAKAVYVRPQPDGRSSVVTEKDPHGKFYCLSVHINDLAQPSWLPPGTVRRLRVLEGIPRTGERTPLAPNEGAAGLGPSALGIPPIVQRRILGQIEVEADGSFNIEVPANTPIELQILDADGMALRSCGWIWARNHEPRGCIGCHEDGELTPENVLVKALMRPSIKLTLPAERRRTVDFRRDVMPIIAGKCAQCHGKAGSALHLPSELSLVGGAGQKACFNRSYLSLLVPGSQPGYGKYVHPGKARTSPLVWHLFGRNTSRPWDDTFSPKTVVPMPPVGSAAMTADEKQTFVEWIDMGALWDGVPGPDNLPGYEHISPGHWPGYPRRKAGANNGGEQ